MTDNHGLLPVELVAPVTTSRLPAGPGWAYEPKWDRYRAAVIHVEQVLLDQGVDVRSLSWDEQRGPPRACGRQER